MSADPGRRLTVGQEWRAKRARAMACLAGLGWTGRDIADVFDVAPSRVTETLRGLKTEWDSKPRPSAPLRPCIIRSRRIQKQRLPDE